MRLQLLSDLHLETDPFFEAVPAPDADLLVLAGDIGSYQNGSRLATLGDSTFGLARFSPLKNWPVPVVYIPGNHEFDGLDFDHTYAQLRQICTDLGIVWLERQSLTGAEILVKLQETALSEIRFLGTTLWADFDALGPQPGTARAAAPGALADQLECRRKAYSAANWYLNKVQTTRKGQVWLAEQMREEALNCQAWLRNELAKPFAGKTVVITHFAPSLRSGDPRYGQTPGTAGFCNSLDDLLPQADLWLHGHLHSPSDYQAGRCRVVANPLGYAKKKEQGGFLPQCVVDV